MDSQQLAEYAKEHWLMLLLINAGVGFVLGLIPLIFGIRRGKRNLGIIGLLVTTIVSIPSYLLGLISAVIFTIIVFRKGPASTE